MIYRCVSYLLMVSLCNLPESWYSQKFAWMWHLAKVNFSSAKSNSNALGLLYLMVIFCSQNNHWSKVSLYMGFLWAIWPSKTHSKWFQSGSQNVLPSLRQLDTLGHFQASQLPIHCAKTVWGSIKHFTSLQNSKKNPNIHMPACSPAQDQLNRELDKLFPKIKFHLPWTVLQECLRL